MTNFTGKLIANTYKDILTIATSVENSGIDSTLRRVQDGGGNNSPLKLSETSAAFTGNVSINGDLKVNGSFQPDTVNTNELQATRISATSITTNTLNAGTLIFQDVSVSSLRTGSLYAATISAGTISATNINGTNITVNGNNVVTSAVVASVNNIFAASIAANASAIAINSAAITSINNVIATGAFASAGTSATLETRIAAVSSTMAASIASTSATLESHINTVSAALSIANVSIAANSSQIAAVSVLTKTNKDAVTSINAILGDGSAYASAGTSATLQTKIAAVSSTMATSIANVRALVTGVNASAIAVLQTSVAANSSAIAVLEAATYASAGTSATLETRIAAVSSTMATSINNSNAAITSVNTRINSVSVLAETKASAATSANLQTRINAVSVLTQTNKTSIAANASAIAVLQGSTYASAGTSAALESRIAGVSSTMATSISNSNSAIATLSATMATSIANVSATLESRIATVSALIPTSLTELGIVDGTAGQYLQTNANGTYSFTSVEGGGSGISNITAGTNIALTQNGVTVTDTTTSATINVVGVASAGTSAALESRIASVSSTMATSINNSNAAITALSATMATSINNSNTAITALSATMATSINNSNTNIAAVSVLTKTNKDAITSINGVLGDGSAFASAGTSATLQTKIATLSATMATSINNSNTNITTNAAAITSINGVLGDGSAYASAGTSATLQTKIATLSATMATSINNSNTAIATLSATMATSINNSNSAIATLSATMATSISNKVSKSGDTMTGTLNINSSTGYGNLEMGGPSGAFIDFKSPASDDYDARLIYNGSYFIVGTGLDQPVLLQHNNSTKLNTNSTGVAVTGTLDVSGGVQVGTTNSYIYEGAANQLNFRIGADGPYGEMIDAGGGVMEFGNAGGDLALTAAGTERARLTSTGLGIETTSPFSPLHLGTGESSPSASGNMADNGLTISNGSGGRAIQIGVDDTAQGAYIQSGYVNNSNVANSLSFYNGANESMTITSDGNVVFQVGINAQTGTTYTTVLADQSKLVTLTNASAITVTIPANSSVAYPVGTKIDFAQLGAGQVTFAGAGGVTVNATPTLKLRAQYSAATCIKTATDTWLLVGDLASS